MCFHIRALKNILYVYNQQIHIYKYVQPHIIILHQHISVIPVTNTRVS